MSNPGLEKLNARKRAEQERAEQGRAIADAVAAGVAQAIREMSAGGVPVAAGGPQVGQADRSAGAWNVINAGRNALLDFEHHHNPHHTLSELSPVLTKLSQTRLGSEHEGSALIVVQTAVTLMDHLHPGWRSRVQAGPLVQRALEGM